MLVLLEVTLFNIWAELNLVMKDELWDLTITLDVGSSASEGRIGPQLIWNNILCRITTYVALLIM